MYSANEVVQNMEKVKYMYEHHPLLQTPNITQLCPLQAVPSTPGWWQYTLQVGATTSAGIGYSLAIKVAKLVVYKFGSVWIDLDCFLFFF